MVAVVTMMVGDEMVVEAVMLIGSKGQGCGGGGRGGGGDREEWRRERGGGGGGGKRAVSGERRKVTKRVAASPRPIS